MIYQWGRDIIYIGKTIRHFFRALFCPKYYIDFVFPSCELTGGFCEYMWCPKVREKEDEK